MNYTIDSLRALLDKPIDADKWGADTHKVSTLLRLIFSAGCSSCMFRRKVSELRVIFERHGDTIGGSSYYVNKPYDKGSSSDRVPCPDCVAKHLSQAYVLQCEFYQGYSEYTALIESHLNEAIEECPKDNVALVSLLNTCLKSVVVDGAPNIPIVLASSILSPYTVSSNTDDVVCKELKPETAKTVAKLLPDTDLIMVDRMLSEMPEYTDKSDISTKFDWYGRMAIVSDIIAVRSPIIAIEIRRRRLKYYNNPTTCDTNLMGCLDLYTAVQAEKSIRGL